MLLRTTFRTEKNYDARVAPSQTRAQAQTQTRTWIGLAAIWSLITALMVSAMPARALAQTDQPDEAVVLLVFERPPYYQPDGRGGYEGLVAGPTAQALKRAGVPYVWRQMQPNGHLRAVEANQERVCAVGWFRTDEREEYALFTAPVYQDAPLSVLARADNGAVLGHTSLRDLIGDNTLRLGTKLGYAFGAEVDAMIRDKNPPRSTVSQDDIGLVRMLLGRRFDYMLSGFDEANALIESFGEAGEDLVAITMADAPPGNTRHLACSASVGAATIEHINAALTEMARETE